jgi:xanthine/uracil permease
MHDNYTIDRKGGQQLQVHTICHQIMARVPPPSIHAINRGIMVEGCLSMISGFFGAGHATSTYGGHIGSIGITKVSVRWITWT